MEKSFHSPERFKRPTIYRHTERIWQRISASFGTRGFLRHIMTLSSGSLIAQILALLTQPILTRIYAPSDYGIYTVVLKFSTIIGVLAAGQYQMAIVIPKNEKHAVTLERLGRLIAVLVSLISLVIVSLWHNRIGALIGLSGHSSLLYISPVLVFLIANLRLRTNYSIRKQRFGSLAASRVCHSFGAALLQIGLALVRHMQSLGLLLGQLGGEFIAILLLRDRKQKTPASNRLRLMATARKYRQYPRQMILAGLVSQMTNAIPVFALGMAYTASIVGWFAMANKLIKLPFGLLAQSTGDVFFQKAASIGPDNPRLLRRRSLQVSVLLFAIGLLLILPLMIFGPSLLALILGERWRTAGDYIRILSPYLLFQFAFTHLCRIFRVIDRLRLYQLWEWLRLALVGTSTYTAALHCTPRQTLLWYSGSMVISYGILGILAFRALTVAVKATDST